MKKVYEIVVRTVTYDDKGNQIYETTESIPIAKLKQIILDASLPTPRKTEDVI